MKRFIKPVFNFIFLILIIYTTIFFTRESEVYRPQAMQFIGSVLEPFSEEGIRISAKAYSPHDSIVYLDRDLLHRGLQPLQVTIQNNTDRSYLLSNQGVELPQVSPRGVAGQVIQSAIPRGIVLRVATFFFWPMIIPTVIDSVVTTKTYFNIKHDYTAKSVKNHPELIIPYSTVNRIVFLPANVVADEFTLYLQEPANGAFYPFTVEING